MADDERDKALAAPAGGTDAQSPRVESEPEPDEIITPESLGVPDGRVPRPRGRPRKPDHLLKRPRREPGAPPRKRGPKRKAWSKLRWSRREPHRPQSTPEASAEWLAKEKQAALDAVERRKRLEEQESTEVIRQPSASEALIPVYTGALAAHRDGTPIPVERLAVVDELLRRCTPHHLVEQSLSTQWKVPRSQIKDMIAAVYRDWRDVAFALTGPDAVTAARDRLRVRFEDFFTRCMAPDATRAGPDYRSALQALDRMARLDGAYEATTVKIQSTPELHRSPEAIRERLKELAHNPEVRARLEAMGFRVSESKDDIIDVTPSAAGEGESE